MRESFLEFVPGRKSSKTLFFLRDLFDVHGCGRNMEFESNFPVEIFLETLESTTPRCLSRPNELTGPGKNP